MNDQRKGGCLGQRFDNRIMVPERSLLQGKAALLAPYMKVLCSVLLVRSTLA